MLSDFSYVVPGCAPKNTIRLQATIDTYNKITELGFRAHDCSSGLITMDKCQFNKMFKGCKVNVVYNRKLKLRTIYDKNGTEVSCVTDDDCVCTEVV
jgi:hypothetical protein